MTTRVAAGGWIAVTVGLVGWLFIAPSVGVSRAWHLTPGKMTPGHAQLEARCDLCHRPFGGVRQDACDGCHAAELDGPADSHARSKFADPRNADRLARIDASRCVTCHREHLPAHTAPMGVTQSSDFCRHCHANISDERPSHSKLGFDSCSAAGCHNYHDNRSLHEDLLAKHLNEPALLSDPLVPVRVTAAAVVAEPPPAGAAARIVAEWRASAHARAGVACRGCHDVEAGPGFADHPDHRACAPCHEGPVETFLSGKHGISLAAGLPPMTPERAGAPMRADARHRQVSCVSCHDAHRPDVRAAAVEACLGCHTDDHSLAYLGSRHFTTWQEEQAGARRPGAGVSCATCHLPRHAGADGSVTVSHNQNANLRPNERMGTEVCGRCHGLGFTLDALANRALIERNFDGAPTTHVKTLEMVTSRSREVSKDTSDR